MKTTPRILITFLLCHMVVSADVPKSISDDPLQYLGKSIQDCEKALGQPSNVWVLSEANSVFVRRYPSKSENFDYIELMSDGARFKVGTLPPKTVTSISFGLKKEAECAFLKCHKTPNHKAISLGELYGVFGFKDLAETAGPLPQGLTPATSLHPAFGYVTPNGGSSAGFRMMIRRGNGSVQSEFWSIQWLTSEDANKKAMAEKMKAEPKSVGESELLNDYLTSHQPRENAEVRFYFVPAADAKQ